MSQDKTFRKLKQTPIEDMIELMYEQEMSSTSSLSPIYKIGNIVIERDSFYPIYAFRTQQTINLLKSHGWDIDEYCAALEKRAIIEQVQIFNSNNFHEGILERAKAVFPNMKYTPAKIEFE